MFERFSEKDEIKAFLQKSSLSPFGGPILYRDEIEKENYILGGKVRHQMILGETGTGKTSSYILNLIFSLLEKGENTVVFDPKGDIYEKTAGTAEKNGYEIINFDFYDIAKSKGYNPLTYITDLLAKDDEQKASDAVAELAEIIIEKRGTEDEYWYNAAKNLFIGAVSALMEICDEKEKINIVSVYRMLIDGMESKGLLSYMDHFFKLLPDDSPAKLLIHGYAETAKDTAAGIRTTLENSLGFLVQNKALVDMLTQDDFRISELSGKDKYIIYIVLPDLGKIYTRLAGTIISQMMKYYTDAAYENGGRLKKRVNFIIEELGSKVGSAIPNLPVYLSDMRSRNIRCFFVLQALNQLNFHYSEDGAETIKGNCDIIAFRTGNLKTLRELSERCGERTVLFGSGREVMPLITPAALGRLDIGRALIFLEGGRIKYIAKLPYYAHIFDIKLPPARKKCIRSKKAEIFKIKDYVDQKLRENLEKEKEQERERDLFNPSCRNIENSRKNIKPLFPKLPVPRFSPEELSTMFDDIDQKLKILDEKENSRKYVFTVIKPGNIPEVAKALAKTEGERTFDSMRKKLEDCPACFVVRKDEIDTLYDTVLECDGLCTYSSIDEDEEDDDE